MVGVVWHRVIWHGIVRYGMVLGMVRHCAKLYVLGMVWRSMRPHQCAFVSPKFFVVEI